MLQLAAAAAPAKLNGIPIVFAAGRLRYSTDAPLFM